MGELLFEPFAPLCQYSAVDGYPEPWHLRHCAERARA